MRLASTTTTKSCTTRIGVDSLGTVYLMQGQGGKTVRVHETLFYYIKQGKR